MKYIQSLTESAMIPYIGAYKKFSAKQLAEVLYLHIICLHILSVEDITKTFSKSYAIRSTRHDFTSWYQNSTDICFLLFGLLSEDVELKLPDSSHDFKEHLYIDTQNVKDWLKSISRSSSNRYNKSRSLFLHLDFSLQIKDQSLKAIRRLAQDWNHLDLKQKKLTMTRLLQYMRTRCLKSDLYHEIEYLSDYYGLEMKNVANPETGESAPENKKGSVLKHLASFAAGAAAGGWFSKLGEDADSGAITTSSDVATVNSVLTKTRKRNAKS